MMQKLHLTLLASPSPSLLEIRILANHGADPRFSFLRKGGKWREIWEKIRVVPKVEVPPKGEEQSSLVAAYGSDSETDDDDEAPERVPEPAAETIEDSPLAPDELDVQATRKREAMALKAREWAAKRQAARALAEGLAL